MDGPLVSFVVATYNRREFLENTVESILRQTYEPKEVIVISNSDDETSELFDEGGSFDRDGIRYYHSEERMGVPEARNEGFRRSRGEIVITVDDDAELIDPAATERIVDAFESDPELGAVAFRSIDAETGEVPTAEFPHRDAGRPADEPFETTYFVGVGNAIRTEALEAAGHYPTGFEYSGEELDLSFRILDAGYRIRYRPDVTVEHAHAQVGRISDREVLRLTLENRVRVSVRNLPWRFVVVSTVLWTGYVLYLSQLDPRPVISAYRSLAGSLGKLLDQRSVVDPETVEYLKEHDGRLYY